MTNNREGVILLHGLCRRAKSMKKMEAGLLAAGYSVINVDYPSRVKSIEELSEKFIAASIEKALELAWTRIHFVTFSLGGILVRSYLARHEVSRLGRVVMLGPPNGGSEVVDKLGNWKLFRKLNGPAGEEMGTGPESTPNRLGRVEFELGVIAGDWSINWINSLMIKGRNDGKVSVERTRVEGMKDHIVVHVPHPFLMKRKKVIHLTISFLKAGHFRGMAPQPGHP